jgi:Uma2 family endonuclease
MTPEEFDAITDSDERYHYELVQGVLVVTPIPSEAEADPNEELGYWLRTYRDQHPQGSALNLTLSERYVRIGDSQRRADRLIWTGLGRRPDTVVDIPTIVVEFVSSGMRNWLRDYDEKRREYLAPGVLEYWVIDRFGRTMTASATRPGHRPSRSWPRTRSSVPTCCRASSSRWRSSWPLPMSGSGGRSERSRVGLAPLDLTYRENLRRRWLAMMAAPPIPMTSERSSPPWPPEVRPGPRRAKTARARSYPGLGRRSVRRRHSAVTPSTSATQAIAIIRLCNVILGRVITISGASPALVGFAPLDPPYG